MLIVSVLIVALASLGLVAFAMLELRKSTEASAQTATKALQALAQVKGLSPHHAAPDVFLPNGVAERAVEQAEVRQISMAASAAKVRQEREIQQARSIFEIQGNAGKVAEMDERLKRLRDDA